MSFFSWFSGTSRQVPDVAGLQAKQPLAQHEKLPVSQPQRLAPEAGGQEKPPKLMRHARREQLYVAIREAMTRAGVLSASYKFKVLSLDPLGSEFLVMMDVTKAARDRLAQPGEMEMLIVKNARARFDIGVPAVYWRINEVPVASSVKPRSLTASVAPQSTARADLSPGESIQASEIEVLQSTLLADGTAHPPEVAPEGKHKELNRLRPSIHSGEFEDTTVLDSAYSLPLSNTQYGDLN